MSVALVDAGDLAETAGIVKGATGDVMLEKARRVVHRASLLLLSAADSAEVVVLLHRLRT